jgi:hypothetical protein
MKNSYKYIHDVCISVLQSDYDARKLIKSNSQVRKVSTVDTYTTNAEKLIIEKNKL